MKKRNRWTADLLEPRKRVLNTVMAILGDDILVPSEGIDCFYAQVRPGARISGVSLQRIAEFPRNIAFHGHTMTVYFDETDALLDMEKESLERRHLRAGGLQLQPHSLKFPDAIKMSIDVITRQLATAIPCENCKVYVPRPGKYSVVANVKDALLLSELTDLIKALASLPIVVQCDFSEPDVLLLTVDI